MTGNGGSAVFFLPAAGTAGESGPRWPLGRFGGSPAARRIIIAWPPTGSRALPGRRRKSLAIVPPAWIGTDLAGPHQLTNPGGGLQPLWLEGHGHEAEVFLAL